MQTSVSATPAVGRPGLIADMRMVRNILGKIAYGRVKAGRGVFRASPVNDLEAHSPGMVSQTLSPAVAADVDAILASGGASAATAAVWEGTELNGVVGTGEMNPPRQITLVLSSSTDWDATNATLVGTDGNGEVQTEILAIPNNGNTTVTSVGYYRTVTSLSIPAQTGAGGTFTIGIAALSLVAADFAGVAVWDNTQEPYDTEGSDAAEYGDTWPVPVMDRGAIWVETEEAVTHRDDVYVRIASGSGGSNLGAFRNDSDSSTCVQLTGCRWRTSSASGYAQLEIL